MLHLSKHLETVANRLKWYFSHLATRCKLQPSGFSIKAILLILLVNLTLLPLSYAGSGQIVPAPSNSFGIRGLMHFSINYRYVPTPDDLERLRTALDGANDLICDATDGQIVFGTVTITAGSVNEDQADVWILPQGGRSGVSFFTNGAGFGNLGSHINLFQDGVDGEVLAHELGHLAFGLGDEYDEQCRWGGPCGIGRAFDPGTIDSRNNTLMQMSGIDMSELTVAANHDLIQGNASDCPTPNACGKPDDCSGDACNAYNDTTNRYESSQHTMIHNGNSEWQILSNNYPALGLVIPSLPVAALPSNCDAYLNIIDNVGATNLVCLVMDRSGSMRAEDAGDTTRIEFAKAAARAFVDVSLSLGDNYELGLVSFNNASTVDAPVQLLTGTSANSIKASINALSASGSTAIGDGLISGAFELVGHEGANPTLFLLSDGQNVTGTDPEAATDLLQSRNIRVFTIPTGNGADRPLLSEIAGETGGIMMDAATSDLLPPIYIELAAIHGGHSLVLPRRKFAVLGDDIIIRAPGDEIPKSVETYSIFVEENAQSLVLFLSNRNPELNTWNPLIKLTGPNGEVITPDPQKEMIYDKFYRLIRLPAVAPGEWIVEVTTNSYHDNFGHILAFVENPLPSLHVDAFPTIAKPSDVVTFSAMTSFVADLDSNVIYEGFVTRPDGSTVPLSLERDPNTRNISASFNSYAGRGIYEATIRSIATSASSVLTGEIVFSGPENTGISVEPFERTATASFYLDVPGFPALDTEDYDNDGILNDIEEKYPSDPDGDGIPTPYDEDSDGDDIPDSIEELNDLNNNDVPDFIEPAEGTCLKDSKLDIHVDSVNAPDCNKLNGSIFVRATGAEGSVKYSWLHNPALTGNIAKNLGDGIYQVTVSDNSGCSASEVFNLVQDCSSRIVATNNCEQLVVENCKWKYRLTLDMTKAASPNHKLGSFTGTLSWDPSKLEPVGSPQLLSGYTGFFNMDTAAGTLMFNGIKSAGMEGIVDILSNEFIVKAAAGEQAEVKVEFSAVAAANTFEDILPLVLVELCNPVVKKSGLLGDVNGDTKVNSTDALIVLSYEVGKPIPGNILNRINTGYGDVNQDAKTTSVDALIILSYELGYPVPYPIGAAFCPADKKMLKVAKVTDSIQISVTAIPESDSNDPQFVNIPVVFDMSASGEALGSFKATLNWDPEKMELITYSGGTSSGFENPVINDANINSGVIIVANANPMGGYGAVNVFNLRFKKLDVSYEADIDLLAENIAAAFTYNDLVITSANKSNDNLVNNFVVYPNPFKNSTTIHYEVSETNEMEVSVYNSIGEKITTLRNGKVNAGSQLIEWTPSDNNKPGVYIIKIQSGSSSMQRKVILH